MINKFSLSSYSATAKKTTVISNNVVSNAANAPNSFNMLNAVFSAKLLVVTWTTSDGEPDKSAGKGMIRVLQTPTEIGTLPPIDYPLDIYRDQYIQFLDLSNLELSYQLSFKNLKGIKRSQVTIKEYIEADIYPTNQSLSNSPIIA